MEEVPSEEESSKKKKNRKERGADELEPAGEDKPSQVSEPSKSPKKVNSGNPELAGAEGLPPASLDTKDKGGKSIPPE